MFARKQQGANLNNKIRNKCCLYAIHHVRLAPIPTLMTAYNSFGDVVVLDGFKWSCNNPSAAVSVAQELAVSRSEWPLRFSLQVVLNSGVSASSNMWGKAEIPRTMPAHACVSLCRVFFD